MQNRKTMYPEITLDIQQHVIVKYLPLDDVLNLRRCNKSYSHLLKDEDINRTLGGSLESFFVALENDDPSLVKRFFQTASVEQLEYLCRRMSPNIELPIKNLPTTFCSELLFYVIFHGKVRIMEWMIKSGARLRNLDQQDIFTILFVRNMLMENRILLESVDEVICDSLIQQLVFKGMRDKALQVASLLIPRMNPDLIVYSICLLFFDDRDYDNGMRLSRELIQKSSKEEILSLLAQRC